MDMPVSNSHVVINCIIYGIITILKLSCKKSVVIIQYNSFFLIAKITEHLNTIKAMHKKCIKLKKCTQIKVQKNYKDQ